MKEKKKKKTFLAEQEINYAWNTGSFATVVTKASNWLVQIAH